ncbi:MAG: gluconate 2-dehydrogenase subunit 3 family protein, partial [Flammeovirgaceae bacterium]
LNEIAETIMPTTLDSPGAKAANIGEFMQTMVIDCYNQEEQNIFVSGIRDIKSKSKSTFERDFSSLSEKEKSTLLSAINQKAGDDHYFSMIKQLVVLGYFSSKIGVTQALRYEPIPGRYEGCVPYQPGEKAWAG